MNLYEAWEKALKSTEILRHRVLGLETFQATHMPYVFLAESNVNPGDTLVREGEVVVEKPQIILPSHHPQFMGFDWQELGISADSLTNFLLVRGISFPSVKYSQHTSKLNVREGSIEKAIKAYQNLLQRKEDVRTCLVKGDEEFWHLSVLIGVCSQSARNAYQDIKRLLDEHKRRSDEGA